ncbi:MAG: hypothetical protein MPJ24_01675 [Pirellulaceae bacterium]|nr:hypothetical protein [Pirellulaceae bacterium]
MSGNLIDLEKTAEMLGLTADQISEYRLAGDLFGYRDGPNWMFKMDEIQRFAEANGITLKASDGTNDVSTPSLEDGNDDAFDQLLGEEDSDFSLVSDDSDFALSAAPEEDILQDALEQDSSFALSNPEPDNSDFGLELESDSDFNLEAVEEPEGGTDDDFMLTPTNEAIDSQDDSGSQVIALDSDELALDDSGQLADLMSDDSSSVASLEALEDISGQEVSLESGLEEVDSPFADNAAPEFVAPGSTMEGSRPHSGGGEPPYSVLNVASLACCLLVMTVCGILAFELVQNTAVHHPNDPVAAPLMDMIAGMFGS